MFRKTAWRNTASEVVTRHQDHALNTTMLLLKYYGPTGFLLRDEGEGKNFKVFLGDPHTCSCPVYTKELEPCKHICWVLLRKFRLPKEHEYAFQLGLVDRQILEVLEGLHQARVQQTDTASPSDSGAASQLVTGPKSGSVCFKAIEAQCVCPICLEELLEKRQPVAYCRFSCGNSVHISCMKVWADNKALSCKENMVKCPLCRGDFSSLDLLSEQAKNVAVLVTDAETVTPDKHLGVVCRSCRLCPVTGTCFKCTVCSYFYLCMDCAQKGRHPQHPLASRAKRSEKWRLVDEETTAEPVGATYQPQNDSIVPGTADPLPDSVLKRLPEVSVKRWSRLLMEGLQCRICLQRFSLGQRVRTLPCHHKLHVDCVDPILRKSNSCPLDEYVVYNPLTFKASRSKTSAKSALTWRW